MALLDNPVDKVVSDTESPLQRPPRLASLIHVVFAGLHLLRISDVSKARLLSNNAEALAEDDELVSRDLEMPDRLANDFLAIPVAVDVGSIPSIETSVPGALE